MNTWTIYTTNAIVYVEAETFVQNEGFIYFLRNDREQHEAIFNAEHVIGVARSNEKAR